MSTIPLLQAARSLPEAWRSQILARVGPANVKVERMDARPQPEEIHADFAEALIVLEGRLELECGGRATSVQQGELFIVPLNTPHRVLPGSEGALLIVNLLG